ncbi:MAG: peptidoglycan-binding protein, partial [Clostridia bacterium]|nr:peptidoglycan-binding protein [Clostridia bacterium]
MLMKESTRGKRWSLVALVCLMVLTAALALAESFPFNTVTTDKVNMRRTASSKASIIAKLEQGEPVTVVGESGNYYKVEARDKTGYVMKEFIVTDPASITTPTPVPVETVSAYPYDTVTTDKVNLRAKKSVYSSILTKIPEGATISVHSVSGTFAKVTYKEYSGYVKTDFIVLKKVVKATPTPTPVPTLSPEEDVAGYVTLQKGDSGKAVVALQNAMIELGFLTGKPDGQFGSATEYAVLSFQEKNNYPTTGVVDAIQQAHIYSGKPKNHKGTKTEVMTLAPLEYVTINLNNTGDLVATVQTRLTELGYYTGAISGKYDKTTRSAVKNFQKKNGLKNDGICGADTQKLLLHGNALAANATPTPKPTPTPTPIPT